MVGMIEATQIADPEVLAAWRTGPRWYHVVVAMIDDPDVEQRRQAVAAALGDLVVLSCPDQPHVTIWAAGFDSASDLPDSGRIPVMVGGADLFRSAAYLTVSGTGLDRVRSRLIADGLVEDRSEGFLAHVTIGAFQRVVPVSAVRDRLQPFIDLPPIPSTAHIRHMVVDTRSPVGQLVERSTDC
jgi:hypothetical protein